MLPGEETTLVLTEPDEVTFFDVEDPDHEGTLVVRALSRRSASTAAASSARCSSLRTTGISASTLPMSPAIFVRPCMNSTVASSSPRASACGVGVGVGEGDVGRVVAARGDRRWCARRRRCGRSAPHRRARR